MFGKDKKNQQDMIEQEPQYKQPSSDEQLERIFECMEELFVEKDFKRTIKLLTNLGKVLVDSDRASFWFWDKETHELRTLAASQIGWISVPEDAGVVGCSVMNNERLIINNPYNDSRFNRDVDKESGYKTKSILTLPVTNGDNNVIGAYQAINKISEKGDDNGEFNESDIRKLSLAAAFCAKTLESHMLNTKIIEDELTRLGNRRGFYNFYDQTVKPLLSSGTDVAVIMCDIDYFKKVNDKFSHNAGDAVLKGIADVLTRQLRAGDMVFRWGGEEFVLILPKTNVYQAGIFAEGLRENVKQLKTRYDKAEIVVTMSFGVAPVSPNRSIEEVIRLADDKLYEAKRRGRNCVVL